MNGIKKQLLKYLRKIKNKTQIILNQPKELKMNGIKKQLLTAPDSQLDESMFPLIEKWNDEPTALQILEVLDYCVRYSLASGFVITLLEQILDIAIKQENTTYELVVENATWRSTRV